MSKARIRRRINVDIYLVLSLGENVNIFRVSFVYIEPGDGLPEKWIEFACFDLPPLEN